MRNSAYKFTWKFYTLQYAYAVRAYENSNEHTFFRIWTHEDMELMPVYTNLYILMRKYEYKYAYLSLNMKYKAGGKLPWTEIHICDCIVNWEMSLHYLSSWTLK